MNMLDIILLIKSESDINISGEKLIIMECYQEMLKKTSL